MAEVLGVVAATTQLTATCLTIIEVMTSIKRGTSTVKDFQKQLQELQSLSDNISYNPLLQTPEVELHIRGLLSVLAENNFDSLLQKSRVVRALLLLQQDRAIRGFFEQLERQKSALCLVINDIQSKALHQIQVDIATMAGRPDPEKPNLAYLLAELALDHGSPSNTPRRVLAPSQELTHGHDPDSGFAHDQGSGYSDRERDWTGLRAAALWMNTPATGTNTYFDNMAGDRVDSVCGQMFQGSGDILPPLPRQGTGELPQKAGLFIKCKKVGRGNHVLGMRIDVTQGTQVPSLAPTDDNFFYGCDFNPGLSDDQKDILGTRVAGTMTNQYLTLDDMRRQNPPASTNVNGEDYIFE